MKKVRDAQPRTPTAQPAKFFGGSRFQRHALIWGCLTGCACRRLLFWWDEGHTAHVAGTKLQSFRQCKWRLVTSFNSWPPTNMVFMHLHAMLERLLLIFKPCSKRRHFRMKAGMVTWQSPVLVALQTQYIMTHAHKYLSLYKYTYMIIYGCVWKGANFNY